MHLWQGCHCTTSLCGTSVIGKECKSQEKTPVPSFLGSHVLRISRLKLILFRSGPLRQSYKACHQGSTPGLHTLK
jgi:hypothetical protein